MPAQRPRASFEPIPPDFNLKTLVESTPNFSYVDRISCDMIDQQGLPAFEKLVTLHVIIGGKPLVIDGFEDRLDPWTFTPKWLRDNCGEKVENARNLTSKEQLPLTFAHYLKNMGLLTNQFFDKPGAYREKGRQRVYLKDIDCPKVWWDKVKEHIPSALAYLNDSTGEPGGPGAVPDPQSAVPGRRLGKGIARAGDLMSSLPPDMQAENLMCYIGHEGTYTPSHREMCASLGQNIMVEASSTVSDDGKAEKPGSSIWFMTESKDRHLVSEYWLSVLGHDIEVENHFAQVVAWKKAPFNVYVVEQRPGDFILIPPLAPHQVWNRGTRTMKVAWNRTTVETLEMALNEALPRSRIVCRDEQYKNKAIIYYTLQKYSSLLTLAQQQAARIPEEPARQLLYSGKIKQLAKDFKKLFNLYKAVMLSEMFTPGEDPKGIEYLPFDSNVTCAYCRGNIFNRFLSCPSCKDLLGHGENGEDGDPYDVCMDCYAMGRSCGCLSNLKWTEQFRWKELTAKYESWRKLIIALEGGQVTDKTPMALAEEKRRYGKRTLADVCKEQLKRRPWKDVHAKSKDEPKSDEEEEEEEIVVDDNGVVKKIARKRSKAWLKNNMNCHVCCKRHPNWRMASCTTCDRWWCYGSLFRGWDKMPMEVMEDSDWSCPHCLGVCFAGACARKAREDGLNATQRPHEPKGTLLGHDTKKVADARSVEALVDFSVSNLNWLKDDDAVNRTESRRIQKAKAEAARAKERDPALEDDEEHPNGDIDQSRVEFEYAGDGNTTPIDPALTGGEARAESDADSEEAFARRLQQANNQLPSPAAMVAGAPVSAPDGYAPVSAAGYVPSAANMYPGPDESGGYRYPDPYRPTSVEPADRDSEERGFGDFSRKKRRRTNNDEEGEFEDITMVNGKKVKKPRLSAAGFRSTDLADNTTLSKAKNEAQRQYEKEKERKALEKAKSQGRFIMLQAQLKGKKRLVKLRISGARLGQLLAQQAAKAALTAGEEADAEHEVDDAAQQLQDETVAGAQDNVLLTSDIAPKRTKDPKRYHRQREAEGLVVTGNTKKALIPVEKDPSYGYRAPHERADRAKKATTEHRNTRNTGTKLYEEIDIASDEDDLFVANETGNTDSRKRRSMPKYLQSRHEGEEDFPDELPDDFRDGRQRADRPRKPRPTNGESSAAAPTATAAQSATGEGVPLSNHHEAAGATTAANAPKRPNQPIGRPAGKRPSMRPAAAVNNGLDGAVDDDEDFVDVDEVLRPSFLAVNKPAANTTPSSKTASPAVGSNARGRPAKVKPTPPSRARQSAMEEDNRLAKLQALQMVDSGSPAVRAGRQTKPTGTKNGATTISMAEVISDDDEESDGVDEVPARRGMTVKSR